MKKSRQKLFVHLVKKAALLFAFCSIFLGLIVFLGWFAKIPQLVQIQPQWAPMQFNTALGFVTMGLVVCLTFFGRVSLSGALAIIPFSLCSLTLIQYFFNLSFGIDNLFYEHYIYVETSHPGRMAPSTAICFSLLALSHGLSFWMTGKSRGVLLGVLGMVVLSLAIISIVGYLVGTETGLNLNRFTRMAFHTAVGMIWLGCANLILGWSLSESPWSFSPYLFGIGVLTSAISLWLLLHAEEEQKLRRLTSSALEFIYTDVESQINDRARALAGMRDRWVSEDDLSEERWQQDVQSFMQFFPDYLGLIWIGSEGEVLRVWPTGAERDTEDYLRRHPVLGKGISTASENHMQSVGPIEIFPQGRGLAIGLPFLLEGQAAGELLAFQNSQTLIEQLRNRYQPMDVLFRLAVGNEPIYSPESEEVHYGTEVTFAILGQDWNLMVWPTQAKRVQSFSKLPRMVFVCALLIGLVGTWGIHLLAQKDDLKNILQNILNNIKDGIYVVDAKGNFVMQNDASRKIAGPDAIQLPAHQRIKQYSVMDQTGQKPIHPSELPLSKAMRGERATDDLLMIFNEQTPDGLFLEASALHLPQSGGDMYLGVFRDVTQLKRNAQDLEQANISLTQAQHHLTVSLKAAGIGAWRADLATGNLIGDERFFEVLGWKEDFEMIDLETFFLRIDPDTAFAAQASFETAMNDTKNWDIDIAIAGEEEQARFLSFQATVVDSQEGKPSMVGIVQDITERKQTEQVLRRAKEDLESSHRLKNIFTAGINHDLRSPLGESQGFTDLTLQSAQLLSETIAHALKEGTYADTAGEVGFFIEECKDNLSIANDANERLSKIIEDIIEISKIEGGHVELELEPVNLNQVLDNVPSYLRNQIERKGLQLNAEIPPVPDELPLIKGNHAKLARVFQNLIGNAVKFTEHGHIAIEAFQEDDLQVVVRVRDTGIGMPREVLERIFEPYQQNDPSRTRGGSGLGLTIARALLELMGAKIHAESRVSKGTVFHMTFEPWAGELVEEAI